MLSAPSATASADLGSLDLGILGRQNDVALNATRRYELSFTLNTEVILALRPSENPSTGPLSGSARTRFKTFPTISEGCTPSSSPRRTFVPPHGYILYIGIAGLDSDRSLRARYEGLFQAERSRTPPGCKEDDRHLASHPALSLWPCGRQHSIAELRAMERRLITAFLPPFCKDDIEAETRAKMAAFP